MIVGDHELHTAHAALPFTQSRHASHALRRQPACAWLQYPPLRSHRALKNETPAATSVFIGADAKNAA
jgi:hypothetical protein